MNKREIGDGLEKLIVAYLQEIDPKTKQSNNSGAVSGDADIKTSFLKIETKHRTTENITIFRKVWNKLCSSLNIYKNEIPILILRNKYNEIFVTMEFKDFINFYREYYKNEFKI